MIVRVHWICLASIEVGGRFVLSPITNTCHSLLFCFLVLYLPVSFVLSLFVYSFSLTVAVTDPTSSVIFVISIKYYVLYDDPDMKSSP
jgi:hypothetical protein